MALRQQTDENKVDSWYPPELASIRAARRFVTGVLDEQGIDADDATLMVSELAANAVAHARTPFVVTVAIGDTVRIDVADESPRPPVISKTSPSDERGRGLAIVRALALRWGVDFLRPGKAVWFELPLTEG